MGGSRVFSGFSCNGIKILTIVFGFAFFVFLLLYVTYPGNKKTQNLLLEPAAFEFKQFSTIKIKHPNHKTTLPAKMTKVITMSKTTKNTSTKNTPLSHVSKTNLVSQKSEKLEKCPSVLEGMTLGRWDTPKLTDQQFHERWQEIKRATKRMPIYHTLQRPDGHCGNETFRPLGPYIRALCNPEGETPCCENNVCVSRTIHECRCKGCTDLRTVIHPKYAKWIPHDRRCPFTPFTDTESCKLFDGWTVHFVGDSLVEQMATAMFVVLTGDLKNGAIKSNATKDVLKKCEFDKQFDNGGLCKVNIRKEGTLCAGRVKFKMNKFELFTDKKKLNRLIQNIQNKPKTLVFISVGIHDRCNVDTTMNYFLKQSLDKLKNNNSTWPHVIFGTIPAPGPLKSPIFKSQTWNKVLSFNSAATSILKQRYNITTIDFFPMSQGLMPYDGTHFGMYYTLNRLYLLFHYFREWKLEKYSKL